MTTKLLKSVLVGAAVLMGSNGSFAAGNDWTYYAAGAEGNPTGGGSTNCIQKGDWIIGATYDASKTPAAITIGAMIQESEDHILDLRDMSVGGVDITALTLPSKGQWRFSLIQEFYANHVVNTGIQNFFSTGFRKGCATIRSVEITSDTVTKLYESSFSGCTNLVNLVLNCPKLTEYENSFIGKTILTNEINSIVKPWATKLGQQTFSAAPSTLCGSFIVTNLVKGTAYDTFASSMSSVTNLWIRWPEGVAHPQIHGWAGVKKMKIELPESCTNMLRGSWQGMSALEMDIGEIVPKHISWLNDWCMRNLDKVSGELVLTNLIRICKDDWTPSGNQAHTIVGLPNVKAVNLAGPLKMIRVTFITTALTNLVLNLPQLESITIPESTSYYPFYYASGAKVTILGAASGYEKGTVVGNWTREMVDNLFASVTGTRVLTLYCSKKQGWKDLEGCKELTDEEKAIAPEGCFGVWESAAGVRKAWMVHLPQADDPSGMCIRIQ